MAKLLKLLVINNMMVKKILAVLFLSSFIFSLATTARAEEVGGIYFFYGEGCPHCTQVEKFFETQKLYDSYPIDKREVYFNRENAIFFNDLLTKLGKSNESRGVPTLIIGDTVLVGDSPIIENFVSLADAFLEENKAKEKVVVAPDNPVIPVSVTEDIGSETNTSATTSGADVSTDSLLQANNLTLLAVIVGSMVDAINPCEFAVLIILMTTILATGNAKKALLSGLAFSASMFISYFLMGLGLYKALGLGGISDWFFLVIGWLAIIIGIFNLKDYFWYGKGFLMEVPMAWRPRLKSLIHSVASPWGAFATGFIVSLFLLPCTSGPYIVILGMLAKNTFDIQAVLYLLLYNLIFISPMIIITLAVYKGFDPAKAEEMRQKRLTILHLITGVIMIIMGIVILKGWL